MRKLSQKGEIQGGSGPSLISELRHYDVTLMYFTDCASRVRISWNFLGSQFTSRQVVNEGKRTVFPSRIFNFLVVNVVNEWGIRSLILYDYLEFEPNKKKIGLKVSMLQGIL